MVHKTAIIQYDFCNIFCSKTRKDQPIADLEFKKMLMSQVYRLNYPIGVLSVDLPS